MATRNGDCESVLQEPTTELSAPCYSQKSTHNYTKNDDHTWKSLPLESCLPSIAQRSISRCSLDASVGGEGLSHSEKQITWHSQREMLEKELYDCARAHKRSLVESAYEVSKLHVSFGLVKRQESLAKEKLEDAMVVVGKLQMKVDRLSSQLRHSDNENRKLNAELSTLRSDLDQQTADNAMLRRALEASKKSISSNFIEGISDVERLTKEAAPIIAQHEMQTKQLRKIEKNMSTGEGLVTDQTVLERWALENALHLATGQLQDLKRRLIDMDRLEADLSTTKLQLQKITDERDELLLRFEVATKEMQTSQKRVLGNEGCEAEHVQLAQMMDQLNAEKITLVQQLDLLRGELGRQNEISKNSQNEASKFVNLQAVEARRECAKALKLVEDKEEEIEYYIKQLEVLREKNGMLRTQLDMEQQCKEAEVASLLGVHHQSPNQLSNNLNNSSKQGSAAIKTAVKSNMPSIEEFRHETTFPWLGYLTQHYAAQPQQDSTSNGKEKPAIEAQEEMPIHEPDRVSQHSKLPKKGSSRLSRRLDSQQSMDSDSVLSTTNKRVPNLLEEDHDGSNDDVAQSEKRTSARLKRPPVLLPNGTEPNQKMHSLNARKSLISEPDAQVLLRKGDRDDRTKSLLLAAGMTNPNLTPQRPSTAAKSGSRLPR
nr:DNA repair protein RAD50-like isoform X1 [Physcomitrium patens]|eukprot:XP_024389941.1 DNA repair protein RAD50-like isoform X1 [Physcomitrella patens]